MYIKVRGGIPVEYIAYASFTNHSDGTSGLFIGANDSKYGDGIGINLDHATALEVGKKYSIYPEGKYLGSEYYNSNGSYEADSNKSFIIFSRADHVVSGRFEFYGISKTGETVHLTEGMFDLTKN